eukprot:CAMPEP_0115079296 /NCGR_PEP_ID=MMETSP0227-20121206/18030_1 /TAXON_ID=89957 /ORGANISM="Polarella glacialis, Strain CCMP 1383" /LENGTH=1260 /DNA_ID=CAMNT_0002466785 /DNA_START=62 /DNA_END=3844 /DNA_ORIENTATION=-
MVLAGWVHEVVLENFKSYEGRVQVGPFRKFTCIVGPNGAGKSNLMDAISFVLGVRTRHLRGDKLADLVHHKEGEPDEAAAARPCAVELVYVEVDESEGRGEKRTVMRRVIQPSNEARFQVDGQAVSQEEYFRRLEAINILSKARNFLVFQGDVTAAAHCQGKDLTNFFEKVSGSISFREEYERLAAEKAKKEDSARDLYTKKRNALNEKKQMSQQKVEADRYRALEAERRQLQVEFYLFRLHSADQRADEFGRAMANVEEERALAEGEALTAKLKLQAVEQDRAKAHLSVSQADRALAGARAQLDRVTPQQISVRSQFEALKLRLQDLSQHAEHDVRRKSQLEAQAAALQERQTSLEAELPALAEKARRELPFSPEQRKLFDQSQEAAESLTAASSAAARELEAQIKASAKERAVTERDVREASARANQLRQKLEDLSASESAAAKSLQRDLALAQQRMAELQQLRAAGETHGEEKQQLHKERQTIMTDIQDITATEYQIQRERKLTQMARDLKQLVPGGVHGRVLELCEPVQKRMRVAVNVALGGYLDAVITETVQGGRLCIQHLKDRMLDPMTFLPLDNLRSPPPDPRLQEALRGQHALRPALSCLSFDARLGRAFEFMLGDVVIADSMEEGRRFVFGELRAKGIGCRVVTLQGETISRDGNLAISSEAARQGRTRFDFAALEATRGRLEAIDARLYELHSKGSSGDCTQVALQDEAKRLEVRARESELGLERVRSELAVRQKELQAAEEVVAQLQPKAERLAQDESRWREEQRRVEESISTAVAGHFAGLSAAMGVQNVQSLEREYRRAREAAQFRENELNQQINSMKAELGMVKQSLQERYARDPAETAAACQAELVSLEQQSVQLEQEAASCKGQVEMLAASMQEQHKAERAKEQEATRKRQELKEQQQVFTDVDKKLTGLASEQRAAKDVRVELLRQSVLEDVELPLLSAGRAALQKLAVAVAAAGPEQSPSKVDQAANLEVDFSALSAAKKAAATGGPAAQLLEAEYRGELRRLDGELEQLRPNLKAVEKLAEAEGQAMDAEYEAQRARKSIADIHNRFEVVRLARRERFLSCFHKVQDEIKSVYKRLTMADVGQGLAGSAFLDLEDLEDPWTGGIKFTAMPPSKRFSDITLLSGGEKTLAAMALLFAMQAYQRPPFLVLDEIDAYLDPANVKALASYIAEFDCQAIVISQKDRFYSHGEGLVGISKDKTANASVVFTMDLDRLRQARAARGAAAGPAPLPPMVEEQAARAGG